MMHYAQVILEAKSLGCDGENATQFARKVVTAAAMLALMPEEVLRAWKRREESGPEERLVVETMNQLGATGPGRAT